MITGNYRYKANIDGELTVEQQIERVNLDAIRGGVSTNDFSEALKYDITRTVTNIFSNSVITYNGVVDQYCNSLQKNLIDIYFELYKHGKCYISFDENGLISSVNSSKGHIEIVDKAYLMSKITQFKAAEKQLKFYGLVTNVSYSILDERGMFGMFSPEKGVFVKQSQVEKMMTAFKSLFGGKVGQRKFGVTDVPMKYSGVSIPVAELELIENEKRATGKVARIFGIQEDMIMSGSTFDNKENAIIQTYTDFKGLIYEWITQIENERLASFKVIDNFNITFPGVPQMNQQKAL